MNSKDIYRIELIARKRYTYVPDPIKQDTWVSHHDDVLANKDWQGDCDDLASTVANLLILKNQPLRKLWFAEVDAKHTGVIDHMIAFALDDDNELQVVGDTFGPCYPAKSMNHKLVKFCRLDNVLAWYEGDDTRQLLALP